MAHANYRKAVTKALNCLCGRLPRLERLMLLHLHIVNGLRSMHPLGLMPFPMARNGYVTVCDDAGSRLACDTSASLGQEQCLQMGAAPIRVG